MSSVLVPGTETGPKSEIQPYTEGRSTFYAPSRETLKLTSRSDAGNDAQAPPKSPPHPVQESRVDDTLEQSRASIISQDVEQMQVSACTIINS